MKTSIMIFGGLLVAGLVVVGCGPADGQSRGFRLPEGDPARGEATFVSLSCHTCHTVWGMELPPASSPGQYHVVLGGQVVRARSHGELVTAIIHPAYSVAMSFDMSKVPDGRISPMPQFNHLLTVDQLTHLVAFLDAHYEVVDRNSASYRYHYMY